MRCNLCVTLYYFSVALGTYASDAPPPPPSPPPPEQPPIVKTPNGLVQGNYQKSYFGRLFTAFEGVPFAKPPLGNLRFKDPEPVENWDNVLIANETYICAQYLPLPMLKGFQGTEDCLYLYIYVPRKEINPKEKLPVIIHIHGGAFMMGAPRLFAMPDYIMDKDVVYVTLNYRVGLLGFLSSEDDAASGNVGLKDQQLALKWIKNNINLFGGDSDSITLTGQSAGSVSVHYHYLAPKSKGLFHRGLSFSGTVLQDWSLAEKPLRKTKFIAQQVNCPIDNNEKMVECLRTIPAERLIMSMMGLFVLKDFVPYAPFGPCLENGTNAFLPDHPYKLLRDGKINDVPWISTNVEHEGLFPVGFFVFFNMLEVLDKEWNKYIPYALGYYDTVEEKYKEEVSQKIRNFYLKDKNLTTENAYDLTKIFTDRMYFVDSEKSLRLHVKASKSPVYAYRFKCVLEGPSMFPMEPGVSHADDSRLLVKLLINPPELEPKDEELMKLFTDFIYEYATKGVPMFGNVEWKSVKANENEINVLLINSPSNITMGKIKEFAPVQFWDSLPFQENNHLFS